MHQGSTKISKISAALPHGLRAGGFDYASAFSRSLGWLTNEDMLKLSKVVVGIAGLGGVGGCHAEVLARLGVQNFVLYDGDVFSIENSNRQNECRRSTYGQNKAQVLAELILDINPNANVTWYPRFLEEAEIPNFVSAIDIYLDGLDYFVYDMRIKLFQELRRQGKTGITAAPLGTGSSLMVFDQNSMSFDSYFGLHTTKNSVQRALLFLAGLAPTFQQVKYLADRSVADFKSQRLPSLPMGTYAAANAAATAVLKLVTGRGKLRCAPWVTHYDPYNGHVKLSYGWWGFKNPFRRLKIKAFVWYLARTQKKSVA